MKYLFLIVLSFSVGFILPLLAAGLQWVLSLALFVVTICCVMYYIETRINAVRL